MRKKHLVGYYEYVALCGESLRYNHDRAIVTWDSDIIDSIKDFKSGVVCKKCAKIHIKKVERERDEIIEDMNNLKSELSKTNKVLDMLRSII